MPKIADIQETPNPNAVKFILKEPVSHGTSHSFKSAEAVSATLSQNRSSTSARSCRCFTWTR
ncbi:MAG: NifU N-terminal domain-containing protein [Chloracidobacterium sp.]|nr:NifU N-terminal domain-containing protein [Chloracidobacterium sp.]